MKSLNNTDPIRFIDISIGTTYEDNGDNKTETGTHLIVFPYERNCDGNDFTSDPAIINYYRQFFLHLDEKLVNTKEEVFSLITLKKYIPSNLSIGFTKIRNSNAF